ncbi:hypothetical protein [Oceanobacter mangrovi]|uniref:hypothetical protein n=1 Tax=Oceanobacter mangrovi TaxID=2862510 RepID=UPI001C8EEF75|nr:hypothetical protein [Oceanobacter mangrovi]
MMIADLLDLEDFISQLKSDLPFMRELELSSSASKNAAGTILESWLHTAPAEQINEFNDWSSELESRFEGMILPDVRQLLTSLRG